MAVSRDLPNKKKSEIIIIKFNKNGKIISIKKLELINQSLGVNCKETKDKGYLIYYYNNARDKYYYDVKMAKLDKKGRIQWEKVFLNNIFSRDVRLYCYYPQIQINDNDQIIGLEIIKSSK